MAHSLLQALHLLLQFQKPKSAMQSDRLYCMRASQQMILQHSYRMHPFDSAAYTSQYTCHSAPYSH